MESSEVRLSRGLRSGLVALLLLAGALFLSPHVTDNAAALLVAHTVGNVDAAVSDVGRLESLLWNGVDQLCWCPSGVDKELGLALDQANYDHAPNNGPGHDGDGYFIADSFETDFSVTQPIYFEENTATQQKSVVTFRHANDDPFDVGSPPPPNVLKEKDDVEIQQSAWTASGGDWIVLRWVVVNVKATDVTQFRFTLYGGYSSGIVLNLGGLGGDGGDDVESFSVPKATYYLQDNNLAPGGTTLAVTSAIPSQPIDRYVTHQAQVVRGQPQDDLLYANVATDPNGLGSGVTNGVSGVLGWGNTPLTIPVGSTMTFAMVLAFGTSVVGADASIAAARAFYLNETTYMAATEFTDSPGFQMEVWNNGMGSVDLSTWSVTSQSGLVPGTWAPAIITDTQYSVFTATGGTVDQEAEILVLRDAANMARETLAWGWLGPVPDPDWSSSVERVWDPLTSRYLDQWSRALTPSLGSQNSVAPHDPVPTVVLNEVFVNPGTPRDRFVEVYYKGLTSVDLGGYTLVADRVYTIPAGTVLDTTGRWYVLREPLFPIGFGLSAAADNVYLYDAAGRFLDMVGWNAAQAPDTSLARAQDGNGTADGYDDRTSSAAGWDRDSFPTMNLIGLLESQVGGGNPGDVIEFYLNVTNLKVDVDTIDLSAASGPIGWSVQFETTLRTPLPDSGGAPGPDSGPLTYGQSRTIIAAVTVPTLPPIGDIELLQVFAASSTDPEVAARTLLIGQVYPYLNVFKAATWPTIFVTGSGFFPETTPVVVTLAGEGVPQIDQRPQDVVFEIDNSGSMAFNDPTFLRWDAVECYIDQMVIPDRGAIVAFGDNPNLPGASEAWYVRSPLTQNYALLRSDAQDPNNRFNVGGTPIKLALQLGNAELILRGNTSHTLVEVLLSDGQPDNPDIVAELDAAVANNIRIFTIGLGSPAEAFMRYIADTTGGQYFYADSPDDLCSIYASIGQIVQDVVASPVGGGVVPMITDRIPLPFEVIPGTVWPPPSNQYTDLNGDTVIEWQVTSALRVKETLAVSYEVRCHQAGMWNATRWPQAQVNYVSWDGRTTRKEIPSVMITCLPGIALTPPVDLRTAVPPGTSDVLITWQPPLDTLGVDGYYLYASATATGFDFAAPPVAILWGGTTGLSWMDLGAAGAVGERYYIARSFNATLGLLSFTGNTAGKFTVALRAGWNAVSYPLEPFVPLDFPTFHAQISSGSPNPAKELVSAWVDATGTVDVGEGFLVDRLSAGLFTYVGRPASMISYQDGFGFGSQTPEVQSVRAAVSGDDVTLSWLPPVCCAIEYVVYRSATRDGFFTGAAVEAGRTFGLTFTDLGAMRPGVREVYLMVVPVDAFSGVIGSGSYSLGIVRLDLPGQAAIGLPLQPFAAEDVSWYADQVPYALGIDWLDVTGWVPHFKEMPAGVYDTAFSMATAYQVSTKTATTYTFIGW